MNDAGFSDNDRYRHRMFWHAESRDEQLRGAASRGEQLRGAAKAICNELGTSDSEIKFKVELILGEAHTPAARTFSRFFDNETDMGNKPWALTGLCWAAGRLCAESRERLGELAEQTLTIRRLEIESREVLGEFPRFKAQRRGSGNLWYREHISNILNNIKVPESENNPRNPEFPENSPRFPATPTEIIEIDGLQLEIKDESRNPTGNHKDRWAWEQLLAYKRLLQQCLDEDRRTKINIPSLCLISSGSAAFALQSLLQVRGLPPLHVVIDAERAGEDLVRRLKSIGAVIHNCDLDAQELDEEKVLSRCGVGNGGVDITTRKISTPEGERFYDWMVCEILLRKPQYIFVPFGTGDLYSNIICFIEKELNRKKGRDQRLTGLTAEHLLGINVIGATTKDPHTQMDKLYAAFRPTYRAIQEKIEQLKAKRINGQQVLGQASGILEIDDRCAQRAKDLVERPEGPNVKTELSGIAGLGLFLSKKDRLGIEPKHKILVVNTGWLHMPGT